MTEETGAKGAREDIERGGHRARRAPREIGAGEVSSLSPLVISDLRALILARGRGSDDEDGRSSSASNDNASSYGSSYVKALGEQRERERDRGKRVGEEGGREEGRERERAREHALARLSRKRAVEGGLLSSLGSTRYYRGPHMTPHLGR